MDGFQITSEESWFHYPYLTGGEIKADSEEVINLRGQQKSQK